MQMVKMIIKNNHVRTYPWTGCDNKRLHACACIVTLLFAETRINDVDDAVYGQRSFCYVSRYNNLGKKEEKNIKTKNVSGQNLDWRTRSASLFGHQGALGWRSSPACLMAGWHRWEGRLVLRSLIPGACISPEASHNTPLFPPIWQIKQNSKVLFIEVLNWPFFSVETSAWGRWTLAEYNYSHSHMTTAPEKKMPATNSTCPVRKTSMSPGFWVMWICSTDTTHASR